MPCVFLPCACRSAFGPEQSWKQLQSHFSSYTPPFFSPTVFSFLPLHHSSYSRLVRLLRWLLLLSLPPGPLGLNTGPAAGLLSLSSSRRCAARRRRRRRRTSKHKQTREQQNSSQSVSRSAPDIQLLHSQASQTNRKSSSWQGSANSASSLEEPQTTADTTQPVLRRVCSRVRRGCDAASTPT